MDTVVSYLVTFLQVVCTIGLIVVTALQVGKSDTGGGFLGLGSGKSSSAMNLPVGMDRFLQPLSLWFGTGFLVTSLMAAMDDQLRWYKFLLIAAAYLALMIYGKRAWEMFKEATGSVE